MKFDVWTSAKDEPPQVKEIVDDLSNGSAIVE